MSRARFAHNVKQRSSTQRGEFRSPPVCRDKRLRWIKIAARIGCREPNVSCPNLPIGKAMPIVDYTPERFGDVSEMVSQFPGTRNLAHRLFVDYYYATREWSKLYLYYSDSGKLIGTLGRELARFEYNSREFTIRFGSNWYSLQRGVGGELSQFSAQSNPNSTGLTFGGSQDALSILRHRKWIFVPGIRGYSLNNPCSLYPGESRWRGAAKSFLRRVVRRRISSFALRIPSHVLAEITVREEGSYAPDLLPSRSPFLFRFAPTAEYLSWRYNLSLPFIRYRLFRVISRGATVGYVILSDSPDEITVAQCDGEDAARSCLRCIAEHSRSGPRGSGASRGFPGFLPFGNEEDLPKVRILGTTARQSPIRFSHSPAGSGSLLRHLKSARQFRLGGQWVTSAVS